MEWARLVLDYVEALAWPLVVIVLVVFFVVLFRGSIARLIDRIRSATAGPGGFGVSFGDEVRELGAEAAKSDLAKVSLRRPGIEASIGASVAQRRRAGAKAERTPDENYRGVILDSWVEVEHALIGVADALDFGLGPNPGVARVVDELERREFMKPATTGVFRSARSLRNEAAHALNPLIDRGVAEEYAKVTGQMLVMLKLIEENASVIEASVEEEKNE